MNISDLRDGFRKVDVEGDVIEVGQSRTVNLKSGGQARTAEVRIKDSSGEAIVSLWDEQIEQVAKGGHLRVSNGYTNNYNGKLQVNVGKFGTLEFIEAAKVPRAPSDVRQGVLTQVLTEERVKQIIYEELRNLALL